MTNFDHCCLCSQIAGERENDLLSSLLDCGDGYQRRIAMETEYFAVIPSVGALTAGHVLLCPKPHVTSLGELSAEIAAEYLEAKRNLTATIVARFHSPVHAFEHGCAKGSPRVICTVDHAHLHLLPAPKGLTDIILGAFSWRQIGAKSDDLARAVNALEYLYYESPDGECFVAQQKQEFESQIMRRIIASALGKCEAWNWREHPNLSEVERTYAILCNGPVQPTR